jgi:hypothetical protein
VVTACLKGVGKAFIYSPAIMINEGTLAMHRNSGMDNLTAIDITYALVPQTDTENRNSPCEAANNIIRHTRFNGGARSRRDDNVGWAQALNLCQGYLVITINHRFPTQFTQVLGKVVNKGIVVINDYDHIYLTPGAAILRASMSALALSSVS